MKAKVQKMLVLAVVVSMVGFLAGCATTKPTTVKAPAEQETIKEPNVGLVTMTDVKEPDGKDEESISWAGYTPKVMDKMQVTEVAFPTGNKQTSAVLVHQVMPVEVLRGGVYTYEYHVTNLTTLTHQNVMVTNEGAQNLKVVSSSPAVSADSRGTLRWVIGDLAPHATKVIQVKATSGVVGSASDCVSVSYDNSLCARTKVVDPDLLLIKTAKTDGTICEDFWFTYEIVNPGSGMANNIRIRDEIPKGLRTIKDNKAVVEIAAGDLAPGERKKFTVEAKGIETGRHRSIAVATADGGLISESENIQTLIYQPVLTIAAKASDRQYLGRNVNFSYTVKNTGDAPAENTVVTTAFTDVGGKVIQASQNGTVDAGKVTWQIGALGVNQSKTVSAKVEAAAVGTVRSSVTAKAECAADVDDATATVILGIPAILLELIDSGDPAEIGNTVTYTVTATNQGSAADSNIVIVCNIPAGLEYLSSDGPTQGTLRGQTLRFAPVAEIGVGAEAQWQIQVRGSKAGDYRFGVTMTSDQLGKTPVKETEATTIY